MGRSMQVILFTLFWLCGFGLAIAGGLTEVAPELAKRLQIVRKITEGPMQTDQKMRERALLLKGRCPTDKSVLDKIYATGDMQSMWLVRENLYRSYLNKLDSFNLIFDDDDDDDDDDGLHNPYFGDINLEIAITCRNISILSGDSLEHILFWADFLDFQKPGVNSDYVAALLLDIYPRHETALMVITHLGVAAKETKSVELQELYNGARVLTAVSLDSISRAELQVKSPIQPQMRPRSGGLIFSEKIDDPRKTLTTILPDVFAKVKKNVETGDFSSPDRPYLRSLFGQLQNAGYTLSDNTLRGPSGDPIKFSIMISKSDMKKEVRLEIAVNIFIDTMKRLGIDATNYVADDQVLVLAVTKGEFEAALY